MSTQHIGSNFDDFLLEEGMFEEVGSERGQEIRHAGHDCQSGQGHWEENVDQLRGLSADQDDMIAMRAYPRTESVPSISCAIVRPFGCGMLR